MPICLARSLVSLACFTTTTGILITPASSLLSYSGVSTKLAQPYFFRITLRGCPGRHQRILAACVCTDTRLSSPSSMNIHPDWKLCGTCHGEGRLRRSPSRKARLKRQRVVNNNVGDGSSQILTAAAIPTTRWDPCTVCAKSGLVSSRDHLSPLTTDETLRDTVDTTGAKSRVDNLTPSVAVVGGGLAGFAFAAACRHRGIPVQVFERDASFDQRAQGYGLTMQQASRHLKAFGITDLPDGITSTKHLVHDSEGIVVGQWGMRHWKEEYQVNSSTSAEPKESDCGRTDIVRDFPPENPPISTTSESKDPRRKNIHISRQALRRYLWHAATAADEAWNVSTVQWDHKLVNYEYLDNGQVRLNFKVGRDEGRVVSYTADFLVGADGIRSQVRAQLIGDDMMPLRYLECFVMLGICPLVDTEGVPLLERFRLCELLDGKTVFQTADGTTRIYMMPFDAHSYMWQLSFPAADLTEATQLSEKGAAALKVEALRRCQSWHSPIPELLEATPIDLISGYPVFDRDLLTPDSPLTDPGIGDCFRTSATTRRVTLVGDAAHPMSPFKGQGANQALLDALELARCMYRSVRRHKKQQNATISDVVSSALVEYEADMMDRSAVKVKASAEAAGFLHSDIVLCKGNATRGGVNRHHRHSTDDLK